MTRPPARWHGTALGGALFDLDGTLLDTAADIAQVLNRTIAERGWSAFSLNDVTRMIGRGSEALIERAAAVRGHTLSGVDRQLLVARFFVHYGMLEDAADSAAVAYPGAGDLVRTLHEAGMRLAVVTNKHRRFACSALDRFGLLQFIDLVVGGDTCERRKPDPEPLLFACRALSLMPAQALMIGDSINDTSAARAAGMPIACVSYGYNEGRDPGSLDCDALLDTLAELPGLLWT